MSEAARPRVSIILADAGVADALRATAHGVLAQTERSIELLIVDDGTLDVPRTLEDFDDARVVDVPAPGVRRLARLNLGIALARGVYVLILSPGDTELAPPLLARLTAALDVHPECDAAISFPDAAQASPNEAAEAISSAALLLGLLADTTLHPAAVLVRTSALRDAGGFDATLERTHDLDLWLRLLPERRLALVSGSLVRVTAAGVRAHGESVADRAERAYCLTRSIRDHGVEWWQQTVGDARADDDARAAWIELATLLLRTELPELWPLVRETRRRAAARGFELPALDELQRLAAEDAPLARRVLGDRRAELESRTPDGVADQSSTEDLPGAAAVHDLARIARVTDRRVRDLHARTLRLEAGGADLVAELEQARGAASAAVDLGTRTFEKLRLTRRLKAAARDLAARTRDLFFK